ncbi:hypothetical protein PR202_gb00316 [Eleusine coracana subsp. coracana]|uniref:Uncharacterized protein n=1 Tax=Eleusine coracana subsp. coracana TaxID=191504 RepID=A0AAV5DT25_ELECO|nr:hypothetical protein PR202_gb00316 [Eleusine coracana subsp. coracana]
MGEQVRKRWRRGEQRGKRRRCAKELFGAAAAARRQRATRTRLEAEELCSIRRGVGFGSGQSHRAAGLCRGEGASEASLEWSTVAPGPGMMEDCDMASPGTGDSRVARAGGRHGGAGQGRGRIQSGAGRRTARRCQRRAGGTVMPEKGARHGGSIRGGRK